MDIVTFWKSWNTCAGEIKGEKSRWIIDCDDIEDTSYLARIHDFISYLEPEGPKSIATIKTKSGYHLITTPFNLQQFKEEFPDIDVHKNNPTLLYCL